MGGVQASVAVDDSAQDMAERDGLGVQALSRVGAVVEVVLGAPACDRCVKLLPALVAGEQRVAGIDGQALGSVDGRRVAEVPQTHSPVIVRVCAAPVYRCVAAASPGQA